MKDFECMNMINLINNIQNMKDLEFISLEFKNKFAYALTVNTRKIQQHLKDLSETRQNDVKWIEYDKKRLDLCKQHAKKNDKNEPVLIGNSYDGLQGNKEFDADIKQLQQEYKDNLYDTDITFDYYKIQEKWLPVSKSFIGAYVDALYEIIAWDDPVVINTAKK